MSVNIKKQFEELCVTYIQYCQTESKRIQQLLKKLEQGKQS